jgi:hypothetical protein
MRLNRSHVSGCCSLFSKGTSTLSLAKLKETCEEYRSLRFPAGAIELPLKCAQDWDPKGQGIGYLKDGEQPNDPRKMAYDERVSCYDCVFDTLLAFDDMLNDQVNGRSESLTHFSLAALSVLAEPPVLSWIQFSFRCGRRRRRAACRRLQPSALVRRSAFPQLAVRLAYFSSNDGSAARGLSIFSSCPRSCNTRLELPKADVPRLVNFLQIRTPFIERYLAQEPLTHARSELLWQYHVRNGHYSQAAVVQANLAQSTEFVSSFSLQDRHHLAV